MTAPKLEDRNEWLHYDPERLLNENLANLRSFLVPRTVIEIEPCAKVGNRSKKNSIKKKACSNHNCANGNNERTIKRTAKEFIFEPSQSNPNSSNRNPR